MKHYTSVDSCLNIGDKSRSESNRASVDRFPSGGGLWGFVVAGYASGAGGRLKREKFSVNGLQPDVRTYNVMISGFCRGGQLGEAKLLFLKMEESGCPPDDVTYRVLLQGYLKNRHYDDVEMLLQEMDDRGYSLDASTISLFIDHIAAGLLDRSMLKLLGKLVPKELLNDPSLCDWE
ncbi:putative tetratricopeptide-like helical domain superfamily [Helianthus debilis subsp. tardiflorus]